MQWQDYEMESNECTTSEYSAQFESIDIHSSIQYKFKLEIFVYIQLK